MWLVPSGDSPSKVGGFKELLELDDDRVGS
jgi:hypothetical protein